MLSLPDRPVPCYRAKCKRPSSKFVCGQWLCSDHWPPPADHCTHSLAPSGSCVYCGADVEQ